MTGNGLGLAHALQELQEEQCTATQSLCRSHRAMQHTTHYKAMPGMQGTLLLLGLEDGWSTTTTRESLRGGANTSVVRVSAAAASPPTAASLIVWGA